MRGSSDHDWRRRVRAMRTFAALKRAPPDPDRARRALERAGPLGVWAAAANPEHSEAGRAFAREAGGGEGSPFLVRVPGFVPLAQLERRGAALFFGWGRRLRVWSGWLLLPLGVLVLTAVGITTESEGALFARAVSDGLVTQEEVDALTASFEWSEPTAAAVAGAYPDDPDLDRAKTWRAWGYGFLTAFMLVGLVFLIAVTFRRRPARLLLLRKFNVKALSKAAENLIRTELKPFGHVLTLSDKHLRPSRFSWVGQAILAPANPLSAVLLLVALPFRLTWRLFDRSRMGPIFVADARDWRHLAWRLRDRIGLNWQASLTSKEAVLIRTSDAWWQAGIELLMASCDAIVADLSHVTQGTAWELERIRRYAAVERCVFTAEESRAAHARAVMAEWGFGDRGLFVYGKLGEAADRAGLRAAIVEAIRESAQRP